jgi:uncharacterized protein
MKMTHIWLILCCLGLATACQPTLPTASVTQQAEPRSSTVVAIASPQIQTVVDSALAQIGVTKTYDPAYVALDYPNGDVPVSTGVCTDVVIRALRSVGLDLQKAVHEDMQANFAAYPRDWGLNAPDANIDHRRVPNLMTYFERQGKALPISDQAAHYQPGDLVTWDLGGGQWHIGIVSNQQAPSGNLMIVHNIGSGTQLDDILFRWPILGHYRPY